MEYWEGQMDWGLDNDWVCEICGQYKGLTWGLIHGICRCNQCHTEYSMRDNAREDRPVVTRPICLLKNEYREPIKLSWEVIHIPISELTDKQLESFMEVKQCKK